jgi:hypothetical protein
MGLPGEVRESQEGERELTGLTASFSREKQYSRKGKHSLMYKNLDKELKAENFNGPKQ